MMTKAAEIFFSMKVLSVVGGVLIALTLAFGWWEVIEPATGVATLLAAVAGWWQTRKAREAVYADNGDGSWIVALQIGRPIAEAVKKQFHHIDCLVDIGEVLGGEHTLSLPEHYEAIARAVYKAIVAGQGKNIHLVLSGPVALSCLIGQMVGLFHFQLTVYQFAPSTGGYEPMPKPTRAWLDHRG